MLLLLALLAPAQAGPGFIPIQGQLATTAGAPVDGQVDVTFRLTTDASGATDIWTDTLTLDVVNGAFAAELGSDLPLDLDTFANFRTAHLGITVAGDTEMPLVPLDHVPYAAWAEKAAVADAIGGVSLTDLRAEIPQPSDIEALAEGVCFDTEAELLAVLDASYEFTAGTGLSLSNNVFSADQTTIDGWSAALISTHAGDASAHHARYTDGEADTRASALITTHAGNASAHHARYTDGEADTRASALITTHAAVADAHHAKYTDAEAVSAMSGGAVSIGAGTLSFGGGTTAALPTDWEMGMAGSDNAVIYGAHQTGTELSTLFITAGDNVATDKIFLGGGAICCGSTPFLGLEVNTNGNARLSGTLSSGQGALYADLAENVPAATGTEAGDVVSVPRDAGAYGESAFVKASKAYDPGVVGVITDSAIMTMATEQDRQPLALSGLVKVKVDAGYGAIRPGDLLTSSPTTGHAMRADDDIPGTIIGKALEPLADGTGRVLMLVMPR